MTDQANKAIGKPIEAAAAVGGVANNTPHTTITRLSTWNVVITGFERTSPNIA